MLGVFSHLVLFFYFFGLYLSSINAAAVQSQWMVGSKFQSHNTNLMYNCMSQFGISYKKTFIYRLNL